MRRRLGAAALAVASAAAGQSVPVTATFWRASIATADMTGDRPVTEVPVGRQQVEVSKSNGVVVGPRLVLTAGHCVARPDGWHLSEVLVGGQKAEVVAMGDYLSLLAVPRKFKVPPAKLAAPVPWVVPGEGTYLTHRWYDRHLRKEVSRKVLVRGALYVYPGFNLGQSGSGLYDEQGYLCGIAESSDGMAWTALDAWVFMEAYADAAGPGAPGL